MHIKTNSFVILQFLKIYLFRLKLSFVFTGTPKVAPLGGSPGAGACSFHHRLPAQWIDQGFATWQKFNLCEKTKLSQLSVHFTGSRRQSRASMAALPFFHAARSAFLHPQQQSPKNFLSPSPLRLNAVHHLGLKCSVFPGDINISDILGGGESLSQLPVLESGLTQMQGLAGNLSDAQRWGFLVFGGLTWVYLTARPGVLIGAIDAYIFAPLQVGLDSLTGRRSLKRSDFLIRDRIGEGSFGVVYSGVMVPKSVSTEETQQMRPSSSGRGRRKRETEPDKKFKQKVILKKVGGH